MDVNTDLKNKASKEFFSLLCALKNGKKPNYKDILDDISQIEILSRIAISSPAEVTYGEKVNVLLCVESSEFLRIGEVYQNGVLLTKVSKKDFEKSSCVVIKSSPILEDTKFTFTAHYTNGYQHSVSYITLCSLFVFIGILPTKEFGIIPTYERLSLLVLNDSFNNKFYKFKQDLQFSHKYDFLDLNLNHFVIAVPLDCSELDRLNNHFLNFTKYAFKIIDNVPLKRKGQDKATYYRFYIYKQNLVKFKGPVTFYF